MSIVRARFARSGLVVAFALFAVAARADGPLKWSPKKGETLKYNFTQSNAIKVAIGGEEKSNNRTELDVDLTWKVDSVGAEGTIELTLIVDRARARIVNSGMIFEYDSKAKGGTGGESPVVQAVARMYDPVIAHPYTIKLSAQGEVLSVKVPPEVLTAVAGNPFAEQADSGSFLSPAGVKNMLSQVVPKLPRESVAKGTTWNDELTLPSGPIKMVLKTNYKVKDLAPKATIDATIDTSINTGEADFTIKINKQSGNAKYTFDPAAGYLLDASIKQSFDMTLSAANNTIEQTIDIVSALKLVK